MGKALIYLIGLAVLVGVPFVIGILLGGNWSESMSSDKTLDRVSTCIEAYDGRIAQDQLDHCLTQLEGGA